MEHFISKANILHETQYDYSKVKYVNAKTKIKIICKKHGEFEQTPDNHLNSGGCKECSKDKRVSRRLTHEQFIQKATDVHGDTYNYSDTKYEKTDINVKIKCLIHGLFEQTPMLIYLVKDVENVEYKNVLIHKEKRLKNLDWKLVLNIVISLIIQK